MSDRAARTFVRGGVAIVLAICGTVIVCTGHPGYVWLPIVGTIILL